MLPGLQVLSLPIRTVCREITKIDLEHSACAGSIFGKYTDTTVCGEIAKIDSDAKSKPAYRSIYNTCTGSFPVNQRFFNFLLQQKAVYNKKY